MRGRNFNGLGSLSGHASSMITSLRNNFRKKDFDYFKRENNIGVSGKLHFNKKASKSELKNIRKKLQKENRDILIRRTIIFTLIFSVLVYFYAFHKY